jgi:hypothetical protein
MLVERRASHFNLTAYGCFAIMAIEEQNQMQEVSVKLKFITPCLGNIRCDDYDRFERDGSGNVIFMSSWWRDLLKYGARALGRHQDLVDDIRIHARIFGAVKRFKRYYAPGQYKEHEAYDKGDLVEIHAMLPTGVPPEDFKEILRLAGQYKGISPYKWQDGYGQFEPV